MQRQARQQGEKGRSELTGSAFCLQTVNIARFLRLRIAEIFSLSSSPLSLRLRVPRLCSVTKYSCGAMSRARAEADGHLGPPGTSDQSEGSTQVT